MFIKNGLHCTLVAFTAHDLKLECFGHCLFQSTLSEKQSDRVEQVEGMLDALQITPAT